MNVKLLSVGKENTVYSVDGRRVTMPTGIELAEAGNIDDFTLLFYPAQASYEDDGAKVNQAVAQALADYIAEDDDGVKYRLVMQ